MCPVPIPATAANNTQCVGFVDLLTYIVLICQGFHFHRTAISQFFKLFPFRTHSLLTMHCSPAKHTTYWHRPHTSTTKLPIVFIHGIGIGLYPYTRFLSELNSAAGGKSDPNDQIGILAIEIMPVSFRLTHHALLREDLCAEISTIVSHHFPNQKFVLASHSYGTVISTHLLKSPLASRIGPVFLIDPVCILLHLPDVAFNFSRRKPKQANEHQLYYFASMDIGVAHTLGRRFFWSENILWKKDVAGRKITISLGGRDLIVNAKAVGRYWSAPLEGYEKTVVPKVNGSSPVADGVLVDIDDARQANEPRLRHRSPGDATPDNDDDDEWKYREWEGSGTEVVWFKDLDHAQVFDAASTRRELVSKIRRYCEDG
jgi:pimeloyl-ACP methyl ester carboxylesterase